MCPGWRGRPGALPEVGPTRHLLGGAPRRVRSGTVSPPGDVLPNWSRSLLPRRRPPAPPRPAPAEASDERWVKTENGAAVASVWKEASDRSTKVEYTYIQRYHSAMPEDVGMTPLCIANHLGRALDVEVLLVEGPLTHRAVPCGACRYTTLVDVAVRLRTSDLIGGGCGGWPTSLAPPFPRHAGVVICVFLADSHLTARTFDLR